MNPRIATTALALATLLGCKKDDPGIRTFDGPAAATVLPLTPSRPFSVPVGFVSNSRSGRIVPLDLKHATILSDQAAAPFLRARWIATGDQRQLEDLVAWSPDPDHLTLFAGDLAHGVLIEAPYIDRDLTEDGDASPGVVAPTASEPVFVDVDGSGDSVTMTQLDTRDGFTTTEAWSMIYTGEAWEVTGSRSGLQLYVATFGEDYRTDNRELNFTLEGTATAGDRLTLSTESGLVEHDLGGEVLGLAMWEDTLLVGVWDPLVESGQLVLWDAATATSLGDIALPTGMQPWRVVLDAEGSRAFVADAHAPRVVIIDLATMDQVVLETAGVVADLAHVTEAGSAIEEGYAHLFVALGDANRVDVYDLDAEQWVDSNPHDGVLGGIDLGSPVVGISASTEPVELQEESTWGARRTQAIVGLTLFDGSFVMMEGNTGCLVTNIYGARVNATSTGDDIDFDDRGTLSTPTLHANEDTGRSVLASDCGGVVQTESWTVVFDALEGNWTVEGTRSGMQSSRAVEDERYLSDEGDISFVVLSGTHPSSDGDSFTFATEDGVLRIDSVLAPGTIGSDALEIPAAPVVFAMDAGPSGGGWDPDPTQHYAMVPVTNSDIVLRVDLDGWTVDVLWD